MVHCGSIPNPKQLGDPLDYRPLCRGYYQPSLGHLLQDRKEEQADREDDIIIKEKSLSGEEQEKERKIRYT